MKSCRPPLFWKSCGPELYRRLQGEVKRNSSTWHMDETFVRIARKWMSLFRAVDSHGLTVDFYLSRTRGRETARLFLKNAMANPDNPPPHAFARDGLRSYPAAIREPQVEGRRPGDAATEPGTTVTSKRSLLLPSADATLP